MAWAYARGKRDSDATLHLLEAEKVAPQLLRYNPLVREHIREMLTRAKSGTTALHDLAVRRRARLTCGARARRAGRLRAPLAHHTRLVSRSRAPGEVRRRPRPTAVLAAPATFNTLNKLRAGISDSGVGCLAAGSGWRDLDLVFPTGHGTGLDAANVRRAFRRLVAAAGLDATNWTPRELRHSFVSLLSSTGMSIEDISHLVGHANMRVTELVYRKELRRCCATGPGRWTRCSRLSGRSW